MIDETFRRAMAFSLEQHFTLAIPILSDLSYLHIHLHHHILILKGRVTQTQWDKLQKHASTFVI